MSRNRSQDGIQETLKLLRTISGLVQEDVADYLGIARSTYTYYETGKTSPSIYMLYELAKLYNVTIDVFFNHDFQENAQEYAKQQRKSKRIVGAPQKLGDLTKEEKNLILNMRREKQSKI